MSSHEAHKARPASSLVVLSPQSADRAQKQATADKLKFNLLVDANNPVGKAFAIATSERTLLVVWAIRVQTFRYFRTAKAATLVHQDRTHKICA
jgi:peroxiredoxin